MHIGEDPDFDRERVAGDATYNLATGTRILAAKWKYTQCVGDNQPSVIEHWYSATWAYNGLSYKNNPNNPNYDANRGVYDPKVGGAAPYQEKVFGRMEHTADLWAPTEVAYPNPGDIGDSNKPAELPDPNCASPTDCSDTRPLHITICHDDDAGGGGGGGGGAGGDASTVAVAASSTGSASGGFQSDDAVDGIHDESGCSCRLAGTAEHAPRGWWLGWWLGLTLVAARRRR
jgi:hypothetical protein